MSVSSIHYTNGFPILTVCCDVKNNNDCYLQVQVQCERGSHNNSKIGWKPPGWHNVDFVDPRPSNVGGLYSQHSCPACKKMESVIAAAKMAAEAGERKSNE